MCVKNYSLGSLLNLYIVLRAHSPLAIFAFSINLINQKKKRRVIRQRQCGVV